MNFPFVFKRQKGGGANAGSPLLGSDNNSGSSASVPAPAKGTNKNNTNDNFYFSKIRDSSAWPVHRVAVTYTTDAASPVNLNARMYLYLDNTQSWYQIGPQVALVPNTVQFFDVLAVMDMPTATGGLTNSNPGAPQLQLIVDDPGAGANNGLYTFAMAPDLTTQA